MTIFYADDDQEDQEIFREVVLALDPNATIIFANTAFDALRILEELPTPPDAMFFDLNMPMMTGIECVKSVRATSRYKHTPIVIFSTTSNAVEVKAAIDAGADKFLVKPNSYVELQDELRQILGFRMHLYGCC
ncbi:response regulator [Fulvivirgaceae bacterium PWU5]|uniref:Response regulator n=1 Tax=Dawidia cretensis TaxID=2782350 RepID=A0AAP2DUZ5_9BACT|nr:response regulator [Dawidia cretensis]MBT1707935.1 response regulator [Dawidia cretensis]